MPKFKENIYIPVWIDLKGDENYEQICAEHNLHSSMDRFEGIAQQRLFFGISIYIPVWIDLKNYFYNTDNACIYIYIPVWIDLKHKTRKIRKR